MRSRSRRRRDAAYMLQIRLLQSPCRPPLPAAPLSPLICLPCRNALAVSVTLAPSQAGMLYGSKHLSPRCQFQITNDRILELASYLQAFGIYRKLFTSSIANTFTVLALSPRPLAILHRPQDQLEQKPLCNASGEYTFQRPVSAYLLCSLI